MMAGLTLGLAFAFCGAISAQEPGSARQDDGQQRQERWERRGKHRGEGRRGGIMRLMTRLNLTDAQQLQLRAIQERYEVSLRPQREEMRRLHESNQGELSPDAEARAQALRAEMRQAMTGLREEMLGVLTPEQRTELEQLLKERKAMRQERRGRRMSQQDNDDDQ
jgi:Spy/CpxP family protein refolding chaperone